MSFQWLVRYKQERREMIFYGEKVVDVLQETMLWLVFPGGYHDPGFEHGHQGIQGHPRTHQGIDITVGLVDE